jgi:hypothetical protein
MSRSGKARIANWSCGIPSHDTFTRVFARLDAEQFQTCFIRWMSADGQVIAVDGKVLRRSHDKGMGKVGQCVLPTAGAKVKVDEKSNEMIAGYFVQSYRSVGD